MFERSEDRVREILEGTGISFVNWGPNNTKHRSTINVYGMLTRKESLDRFTRICHFEEVPISPELQDSLEKEGVERVVWLKSGEDLHYATMD